MRLKPILDTSLTLLVVVAASLVIWRQIRPAVLTQAQSPVEEAAGTLSAELSANARGAGRVALIEFADFQCPYCGRHAREVEPEIRKAFIETGIVRQIFVNYPLGNHPHAGPASEAAICAGRDGRFWEMHDALFQNQLALGSADLTDRARELGMDASRFSECLGTGQARSELDRDVKVARTLGVQATPTFFLGLVQADGSIALKKRLNGAVPFSQFLSAIKEVVPSADDRQVRNLPRLLTP